MYNHADYRLMSKRALDALALDGEVNLFLRGMVPLVGYKSTTVGYSRHERLAGKSHYPLSKMVSLAIAGITSMSIKPIRIISVFGFIVSFVSFIAVIWAIVSFFAGKAVAGWASTVSLLCFLSGVQIMSIGVIGEYVGRTYLEAKGRRAILLRNELIALPVCLTKANEQTVLLVRVGGARFLGCCGNGAMACNDRRFLVCVRLSARCTLVGLLALCEVECNGECDERCYFKRHGVGGNGALTVRSPLAGTGCACGAAALARRFVARCRNCPV